MPSRPPTSSSAGSSSARCRSLSSTAARSSSVRYSGLPPGGISSDGRALYVTTGDTMRAKDWSDGEAVIRLASDGALDRTTPTQTASAIMIFIRIWRMRLARRTSEMRAPNAKEVGRETKWTRNQQPSFSSNIRTISTSEGGTLHQAVKPVMEQTNMLANTVETVKQARALGATIVYAPITFTDDYHELSPNPYGILKGGVDSKSFRQGTWGAQIVDVLKPEAGDIVIEGKRGLCGFATTNLDFILRSRGISTIALGGFLTNCCVELTMRTGYEKGYDVITLKDCTATLSEEEQRAAVEKNYPMFSRPMTHGEFLSMLEGSGVVETKSRGYEAA